MKLKTLIDWFWSFFAIEPSEKTVPVMTPEELMETAKEEISIPEPEVKMTMLEKLLFFLEDKELTDLDCLFFVSIIMKAKKDGSFAEWLKEETNLDVIERWQRTTPKLFGRANKSIFTSDEGSAAAAVLLSDLL